MMLMTPFTGRRFMKTTSFLLTTLTIPTPPTRVVRTLEDLIHKKPTEQTAPFVLEYSYKKFYGIQSKVICPIFNGVSASSSTTTSAEITKTFRLFRIFGLVEQDVKLLHGLFHPFLTDKSKSVTIQSCGYDKHIYTRYSNSVFHEFGLEPDVSDCKSVFQRNVILHPIVRNTVSVQDSKCGQYRWIVFDYGL